MSLSSFFSNPVVQATSNLIMPGSGSLENYFSGANRTLPNGGGSYTSAVPAQMTAPAAVTPASTAAASVSGPTDTSGGNTGASGGSTGNGSPVAPEDIANMVNAYQQYNLQNLEKTQGSSSDILAGLTGLANTQNAYATGQINPFAGTGTNLDPNTQAGTYGAPLPMTADELNALHTGAANVLQPDVTALQNKLGNTEEQDLYATRNGGTLPPPSFTPGELTALGQGGPAAIAAGNSADWNSATAKILEAQKQSLDSQRLGYLQSTYDGGSGPIDTTNLQPITNGPGTAAFIAGGANGTLQNQNYGTPAYTDAQGNKLDALGNPWPAQNQYNLPKVQTPLSNTYLASLQKATQGSKAGTIQAQASKINSAIHAMTLVNQLKASGDTASPSQYLELATDAAGLLSGSSGGTDSQINGLIAPSLQGTINNVYGYLTSSPQAANSQANYDRLIQTIINQGNAADGLMDSTLTGSAAVIPPGLDPARALQIQSQFQIPNFEAYMAGSGYTANPFSSSSKGGGSGSSGSTGSNWFSSYLGGSAQ